MLAIAVPFGIAYAIQQSTAVPSTELDGDEQYVQSVAWSETWGIPVVISGGKGGDVDVWSADSGEHMRAMTTGSSVWVLEVGAVNDEPVVVSAGDGADATVWDLESGDVRATLSGHDAYIESLDVGMVNDTPAAITGSDDDTARIWDLETGDSLAVLDGHDGKVCNVVLGEASTGSIAVTGSLDDAVPTRVWDADSGELLHMFAKQSNYRSDCPDLALGEVGEESMILHSDGGLAFISNAVTGAEVAALDGHHEGVCDVAWGALPDQQIAVTTSDDGAVQLWDAVSGEPVRTLVGDSSLGVGVCAIEWTTMGDHPVLITGDSLGVARIWDPLSGKVLLTLEGHESKISDLTWGELDGHPAVVTSSIDGTSRVWDVRDAVANFDESNAS
ncbi:hypothetical protein LO763_22150 [Glycomyces sp. A-F 0318]|uniref:WD40 repeat domain-containing protein n=1 Tax=Glycomyces amatae TaxID=2881355 RepID=UPI001E4535D8|nr:hypothetical protein [Glycomyces amatae]